MEIDLSKLGISKGPWKWGGNEDCDLLKDMEGETVMDDGSAYGEYSQTIKPDSPNGKVIALAPEMLKVLLDEYTFLETYLGTWADGIDNVAYGRFLNRQVIIAQTIEKATGKTWEEVKEIIYG